MIPERNATLAIRLAEQGWTVGSIADHLGHDRKTIRIYVNGSRAPGQPRQHAQSFAPFAGYAARRVRDDPHLRASGLHRELAGLGYAGSYSALTRELRNNGIGTSCAACPPKPTITSPPTPIGLPWDRRPQSLPIRIAPITGETIASYLTRLAAANHLPASVLRAHLPPWFTARISTHDDLSGITRAGPEHVELLTTLTGLSATSLLRALPAFGFGTQQGRPQVRATRACRRCTARHGHTDPVPVHLPAHQRLCARHRIWLGHTCQIDLAATPEVIRAHHRALRLAHRYSAPQLMFAELAAHQQITAIRGDDEYPEPAQQRITAFVSSGPGLRVGQSDLVEAATYPETISIAAQTLNRSRVTRG